VNIFDIKPELKTSQDRLITLEEVENAIATASQAIIPIRGDCLEGARVMGGGWVAVDFTRFPAPPRSRSKGGDSSEDLCLCYAVFPGTKTPAIMGKAYMGVWGSWQMVGTHYKSMWVGDKFRMNCAMRAERIFGVIFASWDPDGALLWERAPDSFPDRLGTVPTIRGGNIGDPIPFRGEGTKEYG